MNSQENRDRLAREVKVARLRKFKTVDRARIAAGVSRGTWDNVERGDPVKEFSLAAIEEALDWHPGRALSILTGVDGAASGRRGPGRLAELIAAQVGDEVSHADFARRVGVSKSTAARWRTTAMNELPDSEGMHRLAGVLGVDVKDVFYAVGVDAGFIIETQVDPPTRDVG